MKHKYTRWVLTHKCKWSGERFIVGVFCWRPIIGTQTRGIAIFSTRAEARAAQATCCYNPTRPEKVSVTVETIQKIGSKT